MSNTSEIKNWYVNQFRDFENRLNGGRSLPVHRVRKDAIDRFSQLEFPDLHQEDWRFTDISPILAHTFENPSKREDAIPEAGEIARFLFGGLRAHTIVFVNGFYCPSLSRPYKLPKGAVVGSLAEAMKRDDGSISGHISRQLDAGADAFTALNTAFTLDGAYINVPDGVIIDEPVHILYLSTGNEKFISQPRNLVITGKNSQLRYIEHYVSLTSEVYFTNTVTEVEVGRNSSVDTVKLQNEAINAFHISTTVASVDTSGNYESHAVSDGSSIYRHNINVALAGEGANTLLEGLYLSLGEQLSDTHSMIDHAAPNCTSGEHYKGILDGKSRAVFNGKILVRKGAQKTNSYQENRNILLSNEAKVDTKPQLEIFADDVKCSHGATVGQLSKESMFYLRSRGIGEERAKQILIYAFANDVLKEIKQNEIRKELEQTLSTRFLRGID